MLTTSRIARAVLMIGLAMGVGVGVWRTASAQDKVVRVGTPRPNLRPSRRSTTSPRASRRSSRGSRLRRRASLGETWKAGSWPRSQPALRLSSHTASPSPAPRLQAKGLLNPLDEVVKAIGEDNIWEQIKRVCNVGGKQYGLVHAAGTSLLIYRKDLATKAGLKPPKTWADLLVNAKALTQDTNNDGKIDIYGITVPGDNLFVNILLGELIKANGGILFDKQPAAADRQEDDRGFGVLA